MKIFLVCSTSKSWMNTGYGHSLLAGNADRLLVSFVEFSKDPKQQLAVTTMADSYNPAKMVPPPPGTTGGWEFERREAAQRLDHGTAFGTLMESQGTDAMLTDDPQPAKRERTKPV